MFFTFFLKIKSYTKNIKEYTKPVHIVFIILYIIVLSISVHFFYIIEVFYLPQPFSNIKHL